MKRYRMFAALAALLMIICIAAGCAEKTPGTDDPAKEPVATEPVTAEPEATPEGTHPPAKENVAKIILLLGQSNAVGATQYAPLKEILGDDEYKRVKKGYANAGIVYYAGESYATNFYEKKLPTITVDKLFDVVRFGRSLSGDMFGLEVGIAEYFEKNQPDERIFIIKVARGGIPLSPLFDEGGEYFERTVSMVDKCSEVLRREGYTPEIMAICWMQGENEALTKSTANGYYDCLSAMVSAFRRRLGDYAPYGGIPFIDGGISTYWAYYKIVNDAKKRFADTSENNYFISSIDLGCTYDKEPKASPDLAHFDSESVWIFGQEFGKYIAEAYEKVK